ncbi:MAG: PAS domain-containing protein [Cytophagaceae bacterium]|nr:PAS domain-containing protein [Cytophagaceae bacterium]
MPGSAPQPLFPAQLLDALPNGVVQLIPLYDATQHVVDFRVDYANAKAAEVLGGHFNTGVGHHWWADNPMIPGFTDELFGAYTRVLDTGTPEESTVCLSDWFAVSVSRLDDNSLLVVFTNVNDQKEAELRELAQRRRFSDIIDAALNGIIVYEAIRDAQQEIVDFRFGLFNKTARQDILNRLGKDIAGSTLLTVYPNSHASGLFDLYAQVTNTGLPARAEHHYPDIDTWYDFSLAKLDDGCVATFTNISASKRAAHQLQAVIDFSQTGIFLFKPLCDAQGQVFDFQFTHVNRTLAAYVGQVPETVAGGLGSQWFPGYKTNGLFDRYRQTYLTGEPQRFEFHYHDDGIDSWLDILSTRLGDEVLVTFSDYTPLKKLQLQLEEYVEKLKQSNENLERFAYVASHDLQEPLRKIRSFGDMLMKRHAAGLDEGGVEKIRRMRAAAERMQALIHDLLTYSHVSSRQEFFAPVDLNALLAGVCDDLVVTIREKKAKLHVDSLPTLDGETTQLGQLFQNLLSNALKFTRPGVVPVVEVRYQVRRGVDIPSTGGLLPESLYHEFTVTDNGIGFEEQYAERIFEAFQRLHGRSDYAGTGIGLAVVKKVVENHRGGILVRSQPGQGATFSVYLPA